MGNNAGSGITRHRRRSGLCGAIAVVNIADQLPAPVRLPRGSGTAATCSLHNDWSRMTNSATLRLIGGQLQERRQMWFYVQMWFPLMTIALAAVICLSVVSFIMGQAKPQP